MLDSTFVTEPNSPIRDSPHTRQAAQIGWGVLICVTLYVCYFSQLGVIGFVGPDEPRYAWIARDMLETGDWVTPRLYGRPWFEKPPLFYWGAALSFKIFGVSESAARLPSAICALLTTLALAWLALRLYGAETARWLLLLLPTTVGMIGFSHAAATDMPFTGMFTIAMVCAAVILGLARNEDTPILLRTPWLALVLFGFFLGLAVLAKGPAAIVLCGGAVFFWAVFTKRWRDALRLLHPAAIASFCLTALPWYILCARRNPDFLRIFIIEHNFKRYLTPEFQHIQPLWYYGPVVAIGLLPWTVIALVLIKDAARLLRDGQRIDARVLFFVCCTLFPIIFFSLSKSKLPGYVLPAIPPLQLLLAQTVSLRTRKTLPGDRWVAIVGAMTFVTLSVLGFAQSEQIDFAWADMVLAGAGFAMVFPAGLGHLTKALKIGVVAVVVAIALTLSGTTRRALDDSVSARSALQTASMISNDYPRDRSSTYKLQRPLQYGLNFYFHRELPEWLPSRAQPGLVFTTHAEVSELRRLGLNCPFYFPRRVVIVCEDLDSVQGSRSGEHVQKKE